MLVIGQPGIVRQNDMADGFRLGEIAPIGGDQDGSGRVQRHGVIEGVEQVVIQADGQVDGGLV